MLKNLGAEVATSTEIFDNLKWMTSKEAAFYIRVSTGQLRNMVWRGQITCFKVGNRLRFLKSELDRVLIPNSN